MIVKDWVFKLMNVMTWLDVRLYVRCEFETSSFLWGVKCCWWLWCWFFWWL